MLVTQEEINQTIDDSSKRLSSANTLVTPRAIYGDVQHLYAIACRTASHKAEKDACVLAAALAEILEFNPKLYSR